MTKFEDNIITVLELLHEKFLIESDKLNSKKSIKVSIYPRDLSRYDIDIEAIGSVVTVLNKKDKSISFLNLFDLDEFSHETREGKEPSIYDIKLPSNFEDEFNKLKSYYMGDSKGLKIAITVSEDDGIYKNNNTAIVYPISGKRLKLVYELRKEKIKGEDLAETFYKSDTALLSKEIKGINGNFMKMLNLEYMLIKRLSAGGYTLNKDYYVIEFSGFS
jgi:hypothetical protein